MTAIDVAANLADVRASIDASAKQAGRAPEDITLVAVSKIHQEDRILPALASGHRIFGENRVQEAAAKWPALKDRFSDIELHLVGPLQTNKVRQALGLFDVIETVDRPKLARALAAEMAKTQRSIPLYIGNLGSSPSQSLARLTLSRAVF